MTDKDFLEELTKTGYLIQAAYSYLAVYKEKSATIGLPMVPASLCCCGPVHWSSQA